MTAARVNRNRRRNARRKMADRIVVNMVMHHLMGEENREALVLAALQAVLRDHGFGTSAAVVGMAANARYRRRHS